MKRFVKHFFEHYGTPLIDEQITDYAEENNLTIITLAPLYQNGIYVLFEEKVGDAE